MMSDKDLWSLDVTIARIVCPLLERFKANTMGHPAELTEKQWDEILDKMIWSFYVLGAEWRWDVDFDWNWDKIQEGLDLFAKYYGALWI